MTPPRISVIMAAYRESLCVFSEAVESILKQSFLDFEFIVVVDDPSNQELISIAETYANSDRRIRLFVNDENIGLPRSLNRAIDLSRGEFICRMDADDIAYPERISIQLSSLESRKLDLIGGQVLVIDPNGIPLYESGPLPCTPHAIKLSLRWNNSIPHPTWLGKRSVFMQKYREIDLCEDYDFLLRALLSGFKLGNCDTVVLSYRMTQQSISRSNLYEQYLCQCFLTKCYKLNKPADTYDLSVWVARKNDPCKAQQYTEANRLFNEGVQFASNGNFACALKKWLPIIALSPSYINKVRRMACSSLVGRMKITRNRSENVVFA